MKTAVTILTVAAAGVVAFYIIRRIESRNMSKKISSEGFETATDDVRINAVEIVVNPETGHAASIERFCMKVHDN